MQTTTTTIETGTFEGKTAAEWRAEAAERNRRRYESQRDSDTDGYVSQWAHSMLEGEYNLKAQLAESNGTMEVAALFDLDGNLVNAVHDWNQYGEYWMVIDLNGRAVSFFNPSQAKSETTQIKNNAKKGYFVGRAKVAATAKIVGGGTGLAGAASCYPAIVPVEKEVSIETVLEIVDNGK